MGSVSTRNTGERARWVIRERALIAQAAQSGNTETARLVRDVLEILDTLGESPAGVFEPQPFGGQAQVLVPSLLSFEPVRSEASRAQIQEALGRSPVAFGTLGF